MFESGREKSESSFSEIAKKVFLNFEARSDDPGDFLSGDKKDELQEATKTDPEAIKKWEKDRNSKYRVNSLWLPLAVSENFLTSAEAESVQSETKDKLIERVNKANEDLNSSRGKRISKELVDEVSDIANEIKKYLK